MTSKKINEWKTPDWLKLVLNTIITVSVTLMLRGSIGIFDRVESIEQSLAVVTKSVETTERILNVQLDQIKRDLAKTASREGLRSIEQRVDRLEKIVRK